MVRPRKPEEELKVEWSEKENDFVVHYPSKPTGGFIMDFLFGTRLGSMLKSSAESFGLTKVGESGWNPNIGIFELKSLRQELEERGYDVTTLKFSVKKKKPKRTKRKPKEHVLTIDYDRLVLAERLHRIARDLMAEAQRVERAAASWCAAPADAQAARRSGGKG